MSHLLSAVSLTGISTLQRTDAAVTQTNKQKKEQVDEKSTKNGTGKRQVREKDIYLRDLLTKFKATFNLTALEQ